LRINYDFENDFKTKGTSSTAKKACKISYEETLKLRYHKFEPKKNGSASKWNIYSLRKVIDSP
jgi:hypothetical protein